MARRIAALRPGQRIIALSADEFVRRQLALLWGVEPHPLDNCTPQSNDLLVCVDRALLELKLAMRGESVVVMAGRLNDVTISLSMKLHVVGEFTNE